MSSPLVQNLPLVEVNVCGQQLKASCDQGPPSLQVLKDTVQSGIGLQHDWIQLFDSNGTILLTDIEVCEAINDERTPIHATLSGNSVHELEQRKDEFSHMQWRVMRDQLKVLMLQQTSMRDQIKTLNDRFENKQQENATTLDVMHGEVCDGLASMGGCQKSVTTMQEAVYKLSETADSLGLKLNQEVTNRDGAIQEVEFKLERLSEVLEHETDKLAEAFDQRLKLSEEGYDQLSQHLVASAKKMESVMDLANVQREDTLKLVADLKSITARNISDAGSSMLKQAEQHAEERLSFFRNEISDFGIRIMRTEILASETASKWLASHQALQEQYSSIAQNVEQCRLLHRTSQAALLEMKGKFELRTEAIEAQSFAVKEQQMRERKDHEQALKSMQQTLNGTLQTSLAELETRLFGRVDQEAKARTASIVQAIDDIGTVMEKEVPSNIRTEAARDIGRERLSPSRGLSPAPQRPAPQRPAPQSPSRGMSPAPQRPGQMTITGNTLVANNVSAETRQIVKPNQVAYPSQGINVVRQSSGSLPESVVRQTSTNTSGCNPGSPWPSTVVNIQSPRLQTRAFAYPGSIQFAKSI